MARFMAGGEVLNQSANTCRRLRLTALGPNPHVAVPYARHMYVVYLTEKAYTYL